jgi:hypothetical protein
MVPTNIGETETFNLGLDTSFADPKLELEYLKYATGPRHSVRDRKTEELQQQLHEENVTNSKGQRFVNPDDFSMERLGTVLSDKEFIRRLNRIIPARYSSSTRHGMLGLQVLSPTDTGGVWTFVCGAQAGIVPEFSTMYVNAHQVPTSEKYRGWRTVLLRLIMGNFVTEDAATKEFGPAAGFESRFYRQMLYNYRNRKN